MLIPLPSSAELHNRFVLDIARGCLIWKPKALSTRGWNAKHAGRVAGSLNAKGYINVQLGGRICSAHRIIYKMMYDVEPAVIDHINGDKADNRPVNLRAATVSDNGCNAKRRTGKPVPKGVVLIPSSGRYIAQIKRSGRYEFLGSFADPESAHAAYCQAARKLHGEFARFD